MDSVVFKRCRRVSHSLRPRVPPITRDRISPVPEYPAQRYSRCHEHLLEIQENQELPVIRFDDTFYALGIDIVCRLTRKDKQVYADKFKYSES